MSSAISQAPANAVDQAAAPQQQDDCTSSAQIDEKKARKRQLDRLSQRRKRRKDRETMERLKRSLEQPPDPSLLHTLVKKQEQDLARIHRHGQRMMQIQALLQADLADLDGEQPGAQQYSPGLQSDNSHNAQEDGMRPALAQEHLNIGLHTNNPIPPSQAQIDLDGLSWDDIEIPHLDQPMSATCVTGPSDSYLVLPLLADGTPNVDYDIFGSSSESMDTPTMMQSRKKSITQPINQTAFSMTDNGPSCVKCESKWKAANLNLNLARQQHRTTEDSQLINQTEPDTDAHLMITAIIEGWSVAEQSPFWNEQWNVLRQIDQICHSKSGAVERLSILFNLRRMLKYIRFPNDHMADRVPKFLHERPSQLSVPHAVVIDYFVWPGFREHVIFNHQRYCNDEFSLEFAQSLKFLWQYEVRDTYVRNRRTNLYHFSRTFLDQADDLRCYTLASDFFAKYPEFHGDAPIYDLPPRICASIHSCNNVWQYFPVKQKITRLVGNERIDEVE
ncbi:hypothetical protein B7463_g11445, partial [Scytalidium lignicola]